MVRLMYAIGLGMIVSLGGWFLISPMLLLGLIAVFRLIRLPFARLPFARVRIDREEGGGFILIVPKLFWTREIRVVRPFGIIHSSDPGTEDRLPSFKIEEKLG